MNTHRLLFHVGMPKTGTSSIQRYLRGNREELRKYGWDYPQFMNFPYARDIDSNGQYVDRVYRLKMTKNSSMQWDEIWGKLLNYLEERLCDYHVILSMELFGQEHLPFIIGELKERFEGLEIWVYLRRQDKYIESWWSQRIKNFWMLDTRDLATFVEDEKYSLCYLRGLEDIKTSLGKNPCVRIFEKASFVSNTKDVVVDFLCAAGIPQCNSMKSMEPINTHLQEDLNEIKRLFNMGLIQYSEGQFYDSYFGVDFKKEKYARLFQNISDSLPRKSKSGLLTKEQRKDILSIYAEENAEIARKFLGRDDGILFQDMNVDIPCRYSPATGLEESLIVFFSELYFEQRKLWHWTMQRIQKDISQKRKMALFGAGITAKYFLDNYAYEIAAIFDNYVEQNTFCGIPVLTPSKEALMEYFIVITSGNYCQEIADQLKDMGFAEGVDYLPWDKFF